MAIMNKKPKNNYGLFIHVKADGYVTQRIDIEDVSKQAVIDHLNLILKELQDE